MNDRNFYDLHVAFESNRKLMIERAQELELRGICFVHSYASDSELESYLDEIRQLKEKTSLDLITGVMVSGDEMEKTAKKIRRSVELIFAYGGDYKANRTACSSDYIDILSCPERGRRDCGLDHVCCKDAREHDTFIEINFSQALNSHGFRRLRQLYLMKEAVRLCTKTQTPFIVNSGARNIWELRGGRELSSLSCVLGAGLYPSLVANSEAAEKLIAKNRQKFKMILKGVVIQNE